jgi:hypothetical protein
LTETVLFPCRSCRAELRAPSSRVGSMVLCGACRERVLVPDSSAIARLRELATLGQQGSKGLLRFYFKYVLVDWPEPAPELRACEACGELSIQVLSRCSCNNGLRLSTSLRELSLASLEDCAKATEDLPRWKKRQNIIQLVVIGLIVLSILWLYFTRNILAVVIFGPIMAASLLICGLAVLVGVKLLLNWQLLPKLPSSTPRSKLEAIEALEAELLRPFLARLSIFYRMSLPASLDDEDSNLLLQLLQKKGQSLDRRELRRWLFVTVFRIDMERIADQLRFLKQEQGCPDTPRRLADLEPRLRRRSPLRPPLVPPLGRRGPQRSRARSPTQRTPGQGHSRGLRARPHEATQ